MTQQSGSLWAGVAETDLEAWGGLDLSGFAARQNPACGVHDPVFARALAWRDEKQLLVLITMDALGFERSVIAAIRQRIAESLQEQCATFIGQRAHFVMVACTHTHSAPATMTLNGCGNVSEKWLQHCIETISKTAVRAIESLQLARFSFGSGLVQNVAMNRRSASWCKKNEETTPALPLDEELGVWKIETADGAPLACVVNFACHPVILGPDNREVSAEYPGLVCAQLREQLGTTTLFLTGAAGDINPRQRGSWNEVEAAAHHIVAAAKQLWPSITTRDKVALDGAAQEIHLPLMPLLPPDELEELRRQYLDAQNQAEQSGNAVAARIAATNANWCEDVLQAHNAPANPLGHDIELQIFRVGEALLVAIPAELFVALGLEIKEKLHARGFQNVLMAGYSNGNLGYVPTRESYARDGYEVESAHRFYGYMACVAPEAGELVVACVDKLAQHLAVSDTQSTQA